jgi:DNA/RNA endonuclease G (NUC1)
VPQAAATRRFEAVNPSVATVDPVTGVFTAVGAGTARFRAVFTPVNGPVFSAEGGTITVEVPGRRRLGEHLRQQPRVRRPRPDRRAERAAHPPPPVRLVVQRQPRPAQLGELRVRQPPDGGEDRCNCFTTDPLTWPPGCRSVTTADYVGSGYSRGHMARSADRTRTNVENAATFYLTNIVPQIQDQNGGPWATLENQLGDSTRAGRAVYIVTGPQFNTPNALRYLNDAGKVAIPDSTWKVALVVGRDPATGLPRRVATSRAGRPRRASVIAVMMPNISFAQGLNADWRAYQRTVDQVEAVTGFDVLNLLQAPYQPALEAGDRPPVPVLNGPTTGAAGQTLAFNAAGTTDPDANEALTYAWDFGDGTTAQGVSVGQGVRGRRRLHGHAHRRRPLRLAGAPHAARDRRRGGHLGDARGGAQLRGDGARGRGVRRGRALRRPGAPRAVAPHHRLGRQHPVRRDHVVAGRGDARQGVERRRHLHRPLHRHRQRRHEQRAGHAHRHRHPVRPPVPISPAAARGLRALVVAFGAAAAPAAAQTATIGTSVGNNLVAAGRVAGDPTTFTALAQSFVPPSVACPAATCYLQTFAFFSATASPGRRRASAPTSTTSATSSR